MSISTCAIVNPPDSMIEEAPPVKGTLVAGGRPYEVRFEGKVVRAPESVPLARIAVLVPMLCVPVWTVEAGVEASIPLPEDAEMVWGEVGLPA